MPAITANPMPLGKITTNAGTPVSLIANFPTYTDLVANKVDIQALPDNSSYIYIGTSTMNTTTLAGVLKILEPGQSWAITHNVGLNVYNVFDLYIDVAVNGEGVIASANQA